MTCRYGIPTFGLITVAHHRPGISIGLASGSLESHRTGVVISRWRGTRLGARTSLRVGRHSAERRSLRISTILPSGPTPAEVPQELTVLVVCSDEFRRLVMFRVVVPPVGQGLAQWEDQLTGTRSALRSSRSQPWVW